VRITILNMTEQDDEDVLTVVRAVNRQIAEDFFPYWGQSATLRLEGRANTQPYKEKPPELRGDGIIYVRDQADIQGALGYHAENNLGIPYGFVFTEIAGEVHEDYSVTLSHEALEMIGDANVNKLAAGPHPGDPDRWVLHWYEMCDAVQAETYKVDGVDVSNFVLPLYFTPGEQGGARNDFLGRSHKCGTLRSFGINPGGYVGFLDPATGDMNTWAAGDAEAARRLEIKQQAKATRRSVRKANLAEFALRVNPQAAALTRSITV
jgi:hypothetical protein